MAAHRDLFGAAVAFPERFWRPWTIWRVVPDRRQLPSMLGDERVVVHRGEARSARKLLRRTLWHERNHTRHIARLLARWGRSAASNGRDTTWNAGMLVDAAEVTLYW